jgi:hypothetical protein
VITRRLINRYEESVGPVGFTLARVPPELEERVADLMEAAIAGRRPPLTDADIDAEAPENAES